jgi:epoxyqueuosine reductase
LRVTEGSPIRRIGHARWLRNVAVALGNAWRETGNPNSGPRCRAGPIIPTLWWPSMWPGRWRSAPDFE